MRLLVLTGGSSSERDVALASASQVVAALRERGHRVTVADTTEGILDATDEARLLSPRVSQGPPPRADLATREREVLLGGLLADPAVTAADIIFLALHGGSGEDGTIQHLLDLAGVPYTGSGALASGLAMDKDVAKRLFRMAGIPTADWRMVHTGDNIPIPRGAFDAPVVVKPSKQGSTVGLSVVHDADGLPDAIDEAARHDDEVMIESFVPGRELTVGILGDQALAVGEIIPVHELFDYECKYTLGMSKEIFPADLPPAVAQDVQRLGLMAHRVLKCRGYSRVDFRLTPDGELFCLEVNTLPGMTATSLLPQSAAAVGIDFGQLCELICDQSLEHPNPSNDSRLTTHD